jgi:stage II sporulation protein D
VISGRGWGHGIGLSQYGTLGYAEHGWSWQEIIEYYYPGTTLGTTPVKSIRVLLASGRKKLMLRSAAPFRVKDGTGAVYELASLQVTVDPSLRVELAGGAGVAALPGPLTFMAGSAPLSFAGRSYRGTFRLEVVGKALRLVNVVGLELYLYGVVPSEVPHDWPEQALRTQAVAARTYALISRRSGSFDVYADVRSQVYRGIAGEAAETTAAVKATKGQVVYYEGEIATTYFFSTSGGQTAAIEDVWPKSEPVPYLVSVSDPYDDLSPYHQWGPLVYSSATLAKKLKIRGPISDLTTETNASQRVGEAYITGAGDLVTTTSGQAVRDALGLRSTWFSAGVLALQRPKKAIPYGTTIELMGRAHNVTNPALQSRIAGGVWQPVRPIAPDAGGLFIVSLTPEETTQYRLTTGTVKSAAIKITVA